MDYGRLKPFEPEGSSKQHLAENPSLPQIATSSSSSTSRNRKNKVILISLLSVALILMSTFSTIVLVTGRSKASNSAASSAIHRKPTKAISGTCAKTRFPSLYVDSLLDFPGSTTASEQDLVYISFNMMLQCLSDALCFAYDDCLDDSVDALSRALTSVIPGAASTSIQDLLTWLSATLTNQDTTMRVLSKSMAATSGTRWTSG